MGVLSELVIANRADAKAIGESDGPSRDWDGVAWKTIDPIKLGSLWLILDGAAVTVDAVMIKVDQITLLHEVSEDDPWVHLVPDPLRDAIADLSGEGRDALNQTASAWGATDELCDWDQADVEAALQDMANLADTARLQDESLLLWMCL